MREQRTPELSNSEQLTKEKIKFLQEHKAERLDYFKQSGSVALGQKAAAAKEVLGLFMDKLEDKTLSELASGEKDAITVRIEYQVALKFEHFIMNLIEKGEKNQERISTLTKELTNERKVKKERNKHGYY